MYKSVIVATNTVAFPEFMAEKVYMREFYKGKLPSDLVRWEETIDGMLEGVDTDGPIYVMIDCAPVLAGVSHRRKGLHVDGYWNPALSAHSYGHTAVPSGHGAGRGGSHGALHHDISVYFPDLKKKKKKKKLSAWEEATFDTPEAIILASSISSAIGYVGDYEGPIREGGDCSHIDISGMKLVNMEAGVVYAGNVNCLHESLPVDQDVFRSLVRLNVPGWTPN
jgi:hypothetical protein